MEIANSGGVEEERGLSHRGQDQAAAGDGDLVAVGVAAVLLGTDVVLVEVRDVGAEGPVMASRIIIVIELSL